MNSENENGKDNQQRWCDQHCEHMPPQLLRLIRCYPKKGCLFIVSNVSRPLTPPKKRQSEDIIRISQPKSIFVSATHRHMDHQHLIIFAEKPDWWSRSLIPCELFTAAAPWSERSMSETTSRILLFFICEIRLYLWARQWARSPSVGISIASQYILCTCLNIFFANAIFLYVLTLFA